MRYDIKMNYEADILNRFVELGSKYDLPFCFQSGKKGIIVSVGDVTYEVYNMYVSNDLLLTVLVEIAAILKMRDLDKYRDTTGK